MRLSHMWVGVVFVLMFVVVPTASAQRGEGKAGERGEAGEGAGKGGEVEKDGMAGMGMGAGGMAGGVNLLMQALDTDGDGVISAKEIKSAVKSLKQLDGNKDGKLTADETGAGGMMGMMGGAGAAGAGGAGGLGGAGGGGGGGVVVPVDLEVAAAMAREGSAVPVVKRPQAGSAIRRPAASTAVARVSPSRPERACHPRRLN